MKRIFSLVFALIVLSGAFCAFALSPPQVSAQSAILIDAKDGFVLSEKNADERLSMASTTKIMTALCALELCAVSDVVRVPAEAVGVEGSSAYLYADEQILVRDLIYALLLQSANDAALALAIHASGSVEAFVEEMNAKALALGLADTRFQNPHGLPDDGHYSTARDLASLMRAALENGFFVSVIATRTHKTDPIDPGADVHYFRNHNRLLNSYPDCIGGKTGFTRAAGRCLVSASERGGARLICVTLNAPDDWNDHVELFEYGFSQYSEQTLIEKGSIELSIPVVGGVQSTVCVTNPEPLVCLVREGTQTTVQYELPHFAYAPITGLDQSQNGANSVYSLPMRAGRALICANGALIAQTDLYYQTTVEEEIPPTFWERILQFFGWKKSESKNY